MNVRLIIYTENKNKLVNLFKLIINSPHLDKFSIYLQANGYSPWEDENILKIITNKLFLIIA